MQHLVLKEFFPNRKASENLAYDILQSCNITQTSFYREALSKLAADITHKCEGIGLKALNATFDLIEGFYTKFLQEEVQVFRGLVFMPFDGCDRKPSILLQTEQYDFYIPYNFFTEGRYLNYFSKEDGYDTAITYTEFGFIVDRKAFKALKNVKCPYSTFEENRYTIQQFQEIMKEQAKWATEVNLTDAFKFYDYNLDVMLRTIDDRKFVFNTKNWFKEGFRREDAINNFELDESGRNLKVTYNFHQSFPEIFGYYNFINPIDLEEIEELLLESRVIAKSMYSNNRTTEVFMMMCLLSDNLLKPGLAAYKYEDDETLKTQIEERFSQPFIKEFLEAIQTGEAFCDWKFLDYLGEYTNYKSVNQCDVGQLCYDVTEENLKNGIAYFLGTSAAGIGARRVVLNLGFKALKIWFRSKKQADRESEVFKAGIKHTPTIYVETPQYMIVDNCVSSEKFDDCLQNGCVPVIRYISDRMNYPITWETVDSLFNHRKFPLLDYLEDGVEDIIKYFSSCGYCCSDVSSSNLGVNLRTGEFVLLDAGMMQKTSENITLRGILFPRTLTFTTEAKPSPTCKTYTSLCVTGESNKYKLYMQDKNSKPYCTIKAFSIHENPIITNAYLARACKVICDAQFGAHKDYGTLYVMDVLEKAYEIIHSGEPIVCIDVEEISEAYSKLSIYCFNPEEDEKTLLFELYVDPFIEDYIDKIRKEAAMNCDPTSSTVKVYYVISEVCLFYGIRCLSAECYNSIKKCTEEEDDENAIPFE